MRKAITLAFLLTATAAWTDVPEAPGAINPAVGQSNIEKTICVPGWTKTIRPPASYTTKLKIQQLREAGVHGGASYYEEDHKVPLEVGGHPTDPRNLSPQPWDAPDGYDAHHKDRLENYIRGRVCHQGMSLRDGQAAFLGDWKAAYRKYFGDPKGGR